MLCSLIRKVRRKMRAARKERQYLDALVVSVLTEYGYRLRRRWFRGGSWKIVEWRRCGSYVIVHLRTPAWFIKVEDKLSILHIMHERVVEETGVTREIAAWHINEKDDGFELIVHLSLVDFAAQPRIYRFSARCEHFQVA